MCETDRLMIGTERQRVREIVCVVETEKERKKERKKGRECKREIEIERGKRDIDRQILRK